MWRSLTGLSLIASMSIFVDGCSLVQPADCSAIAEYQPQTGMVPTRDLILSFNHGQGPLPRLDPLQMKAGQHVMMLAGGESDSFPDEVAIFTKPIFGTVKQLDGDRVVLQDVVLISELRSSSSVPIVSSVPYISRLFKKTGVARVPTRIPGVVTIELSKIVCVSEVTEVEFDARQKNGRYERIGVDFDFNIADGGTEITPQ